MKMLMSAKEDAERANGAKSDFLAKMSHELRTPLNAVLGYSEILLEDAELEGRGEQISDLQKISSAGKHLLAMVNDNSRHFQDRSRQDGAQCRDHRSRQDHPGSGIHRPSAGRQEHQRLHRRTRRGPRVHSRRCDKAAPGHLQPAQQCVKVHQNGQITLSATRKKVNGSDWIAIAVGYRRRHQQGNSRTRCSRTSRRPIPPSPQSTAERASACPQPESTLPLMGGKILDRERARSRLVLHDPHSGQPGRHRRWRGVPAQGSRRDVA